MASRYSVLAFSTLLMLGCAEPDPSADVVDDLNVAGGSAQFVPSERRERILYSEVMPGFHIIVQAIVQDRAPIVQLIAEAPDRSRRAQTLIADEAARWSAGAAKTLHVPITLAPDERITRTFGDFPTLEVSRAGSGGTTARLIVFGRIPNWSRS